MVNGSTLIGSKVGLIAKMDVSKLSVENNYIYDDEK